MKRPPRVPAVLFVHDAPVAERATLHLLKTAFTVTEADDIDTAKNLIELDTPFDCVVSDITLSAADRTSFVRWLDRKRPWLARRTVVVGASRSFPSGASIRKPYLPHDLIDTINRVLATTPEARTHDGAERRLQGGEG